MGMGPAETRVTLGVLAALAAKQPEPATAPAAFKPSVSLHEALSAAGVGNPPTAAPAATPSNSSAPLAAALNTNTPIDNTFRPGVRAAVNNLALDLVRQVDKLEAASPAQWVEIAKLGLVKNLVARSGLKFPQGVPPELLKEELVPKLQAAKSIGDSGPVADFIYPKPENLPKGSSYPSTEDIAAVRLTLDKVKKTQSFVGPPEPIEVVKADAASVVSGAEKPSAPVKEASPEQVLRLAEAIVDPKFAKAVSGLTPEAWRAAVDTIPVMRNYDPNGKLTQGEFLGMIGRLEGSAPTLASFLQPLSKYADPKLNPPVLSPEDVQLAITAIKSLTGKSSG